MGCYDDNQVLLYSKDGFHIRVRTPAALEVNQDSRQAVLPSYELCFGSRWYVPRTRFNFRLDTLYTNHDMGKALPWSFNSLTDNEAAKLRYLAFDISLWDVVGDSVVNEVGFKNNLRRSIKSLKGLEELFISRRAEWWFNDNIDEWGGSWVYFHDKSNRIQLLNELLPMLSFASEYGLPSECPPVFEGFMVNKHRYVIALGAGMTAVPLPSKSGEEDGSDTSGKEEEPANNETYTAALSRELLCNHRPLPRSPVSGP
ncbi:hypothetical protein BDZ45DRAFT_691529 [Acephala macrosclerotiorum]|nr:hypothetical protein BDZ45DRAFT_691529 [Acephala macrosclerotiorum]